MHIKLMTILWSSKIHMLLVFQDLLVQVVMVIQKLITVMEDMLLECLLQPFLVKLSH